MNTASVPEVERVARESYGKLVALLAAEFQNVAAAEDAVSDALVRALTYWQQAVPQSPEGWLLITARRRLIDEARRNGRASSNPELLSGLTELCDTELFPMPDRRLALLFVCAHPAIDAASRAPLILQTVLGLEAGRIADAFLVPPAAMAQRLVRAKRKIRDAGIPFEIPASTEIRGRLEAVLQAVYACYGEGWSAPSHAETRRDLAQEAVWLARMLAELCPQEPEELGLLALLLHLEARSQARHTRDGDYIPLSEQNAASWNAELLAEAERLLRRAAQYGRFGRFQFEAAIQSAHAARRKTGSTDWKAILLLYDALRMIVNTPVILINRAVAVGEVHGPEAALVELDRLLEEERIQTYQPYWASRAEILRRMGCTGPADQAYDRAIELSGPASVKRFLCGQKQRMKV